MGQVFKEVTHRKHQKSLSSRRWAVLVLPLLLIAAFGKPVLAHRSGVPFFLLVNATDGTLQMEVETDPVFMGIQDAPREAVPTSPAEKILVERFFADTLEILLDGEVVPWRPEASTCRFEPPEDSSEPVHLIAEFALTLPENASRMSIRLSPLGGSNLMILFQREGVPARRHQILFPGETTKEWTLPPPPAIALPGAAAESDRDGEKKPPDAPADSSVEQDGPSAFALAWKYVISGFRHVLPLGWDHVLFVIGFSLLTRHLRSLALQVTAFTIAHSITLALAAKGTIHAPAGIVEPVIALSIAVVALENLFHDRLGKARLALIFVFGLIHGVGFAGQFTALPLARDSFLLAVFGFNVGVELAQLVIVVLLWAVLYPVARRLWYRTRVVRPISLVIAGIGLFLALQRIFGG